MYAWFELLAFAEANVKDLPKVAGTNTGGLVCQHLRAWSSCLHISPVDVHATVIAEKKLGIWIVSL